MRLKAEMWDKMQFLFRNYYDRMVHGVLYYDCDIDVTVLSNELVAITEKVPVLHSSFCNNPIRPYWKVREYKIEDILTVKTTQSLEKDIDSFITQSIPVENNVQFKMAVLKHDKGTVICMVVNHMCFDGGDFKYFLTKLAENYNNIRQGKSRVEVKQGSRDFKAVYTKFNDEEKKVAKGLYKNVSTVKDKHTFPLTEDRSSDKCGIHRRVIPAELFRSFKDTGKRMNVTVNDLMLAVYVRALYEIGHYDKKGSLTIPCMVDLRRHIEGGGEQGGFTNHTGFMQCSVKEMGETINDTLIQVIRSVLINKRDKYMGLYSLPLLKLAYTVFPHAISEFAIKIGYLNPLIGMSNIGILDYEKLKFGDGNLVDGWITGGIKYKPYMQLALTTLRDNVSMTIAIRGNDDDAKIVDNFFDLIIKNIKGYIELNKYYGENKQ